jgi:hypothetical protein
VSARDAGRQLALALRAMRLGRLAILLLVSLAAALAADWLRTERVVFPAPLPAFHTLRG